MHIYKENALSYFHKGITTIPDAFRSKTPPRGFGDKFGKWTQWCDTPMRKEDMESIIASYEKSNIAIPLGASSGLAAIDVDTTDPVLLKFLSEFLPPSPVERIGSKGFVRFYKWTPEQDNYKIEKNGEVILEVFFNKKKVTIPPSIHPAGMQYIWKNDIGLLDIDLNTLGPIPTFLISNLDHTLKSRFPDKFGMPSVENNKGNYKIVNGRTDALVKKAGQLIGLMDRSAEYSLDRIAHDLMIYDEQQHKEPLFSDLAEQSQSHTHKLTNSYKFIINLLDGFQHKRFKSNEVYTTIGGGSFQSREQQQIYELGLTAKTTSTGKPKKVKGRVLDWE